jgi:hypothetical protein
MRRAINPLFDVHDIPDMYIINPYVIGTPAGITYLLEEDCESGSTPSGWTDVNSPTWGYATSPAPLVGSGSLRCNAAGTAVNSYKAITASDEVWVKFKLNFAAAPSGNSQIATLYNSTTAVSIASIKTTRKLYCSAGGSNSSDTSSALTAGTTYNVWLHYIKGTGSNAYASVGFSTDDTEPTSGSTFTSISTGTATAQINRCRFGNVSSLTFDAVYDKLRAAAVSIGSA